MDLGWTQMNFRGPGLTLVGPGLTRVRPGLTRVEPGKTPGKNPGTTREKPGLNQGKPGKNPGKTQEKPRSDPGLACVTLFKPVGARFKPVGPIGLKRALRFTLARHHLLSLFKPIGAYLYYRLGGTDY